MREPLPTEGASQSPASHTREIHLENAYSSYAAPSGNAKQIRPNITGKSNNHFPYGNESSKLSVFLIYLYSEFPTPSRGRPALNSTNSFSSLTPGYVDIRWQKKEQQQATPVPCPTMLFLWTQLI